MTYEQFWQSSFEDMALRGEAYLRNNRSSGMYFREMYALLYNINRNEKAPVLEGKDVLAIHGDKVRKERRQKSIVDDPVAMAEWQKKLGEMTRRENDESSLFELQPHDYLKRRAAGEITAEMVEYLMRERYFKENPEADADSFVMPIITNPLSTGAPGPLPLPTLVALKQRMKAEKEAETSPLTAPTTPTEVAETKPEPELKLEQESASPAKVNSFVPPKLTGEAMSIQMPQEWD